MVGVQASLLSAQVLGTAYQSTEVPMYVPVYLGTRPPPALSLELTDGQAGRHPSASTGNSKHQPNQRPVFTCIMPIS